MYKKLPHINLEEHYQFITFRTQDSIDDFVLKIYNNSDLTNKIKQYKIDYYLDNSNKGAYLFGDKIDTIRDVILNKEKKSLYVVEAFSIMPNHVHLLIKQKDDLSKIMKYIKAKSALELNKKLNKKGRFWQNSYFDKVVRDQKHFERVYEYILNNHIKAELKDGAKRVYSRY